MEVENIDDDLLGDDDDDADEDLVKLGWLHLCINKYKE